VSEKTAKNVLRDFGLTSKEAEVYIFLAKYEVLTGGEIAKQTKIARSLVYRILKSLQSKGLVEATLESPTRFVAVPFEKALDLIIKTKQEEALRIERAKKGLLEDWKVISKAKPKTKYERFVVIEGNKKIYLKMLQMIKETKNQFSGILPVSDLARAEQFGVFDAAYNHPLKNRIKVQFVTVLNSQNLEAVKLFKPKLKTELDLRARNLQQEATPLPRLVIRDVEEVMFFIRPEGEVATRKQGDVCIYTNCESLVQTFNGVFQNLWHGSANLKTKITEMETGKLPKTDFIVRGHTAQTFEPAEGAVFSKKPSKEKEFAPERVFKIRLLKEEERDILDVASVVGEEFSSEALEKITGSSRLKVLKTLIHIESEYQLIHSVEDRYKFSSPKVREALYNEIKPKLRRAYHNLTARYLEEANKDHLEDFTNDLAHHYYHSKNAKKASPYLLKAGEKLRKQFAFLGALKNYSKALEMMDNGEAWKKERITALENIGDLYASLGEHEKANESYSKGIAIAEDEATARRMQRKIRRKRIIEKDGVKIQYYVYGEGEQTILFVWNSIHFMPQIQYFSQKHKVAIMDFEEIWESKNFPTEYTVDLYTENLRAIIEDLQDTNIFLAGIALGGTLAIRYVANYQGKVTKLALLATPPKPPLSDSKERKKRFEEFWALALQSPSWGLKNFYEKVMAPVWSRTVVGRARSPELAKIASKLPPEIRLITLKILVEADVRPFLGQIKVPTLILHGEKDPLPMEDVEYMKKRIPGSKLHIFKDARFVSISELDKFNKILKDFLITDEAAKD
jgi:sugar-specific transcriptional regulator TrmB/pimeloyl-ACP methyl ester carboxylesterase